MKMFHTILRLAMSTLLLSACMQGKPTSSRLEIAKKQTYDLAAKLGDSPDNRLAENGAEVAIPSNTGRYVVYFLTQDNRLAFQPRLEKLGKLSPGSETMVEEPLDVIGRMGDLKRHGDPSQVNIVRWSVIELPDVHFTFYDLSSITKTTYTYNGKPIVGNVVDIESTYQLVTTTQ